MVLPEHVTTIEVGSAINKLVSSKQGIEALSLLHALLKVFKDLDPNETPFLKIPSEDSKYLRSLSGEIATDGIAKATRLAGGIMKKMGYSPPKELSQGKLSAASLKSSYPELEDEINDVSDGLGAFLNDSDDDSDESGGVLNNIGKIIGNSDILTKKNIKSLVKEFKGVVGGDEMVSGIQKMLSSESFPELVKTGAHKILGVLDDNADSSDTNSDTDTKQEKPDGATSLDFDDLQSKLDQVSIDD